MTTYKSYVTREIGNFLWDGFTDPAGVGVNVFDILDGAALVGVDLTDDQKDGVLSHANYFGEWTSNDEDVRDAIEAVAALLDGFEDNTLAVNYVASDPIDFTILPYGATTKADYAKVLH